MTERKLAGILALLWLLGGCGTSSSSFQPATAQTLPPSHPRERYSGQVAEPGQVGPYTLDLEWERQGNSVQGIGRLRTAPGVGFLGEVTGFDDGNRHDLTMDLRPRFGVVRLTGNGSDATGQRQLSGTYSSQGTQARVTAGTYTVNASSSPGSDVLPGSYTLSLDRGQSYPLLLSWPAASDPLYSHYQYFQLRPTDTILLFAYVNTDWISPQGGVGSYVGGAMTLDLTVPQLEPYAGYNGPPLASVSLYGPPGTGKYWAIDQQGKQVTGAYVLTRNGP